VELLRRFSARANGSVPSPGQWIAAALARVSVTAAYENQHERLVPRTARDPLLTQAVSSSRVGDAVEPFGQQTALVDGQGVGLRRTARSVTAAATGTHRRPRSNSAVPGDGRTGRAGDGPVAWTAHSSQQQPLSIGAAH
jgi:hypothetical protein